MPPGVEDVEVWPCALPYHRAWLVLQHGRTYAMGSMGGFPHGLLYSEVARYATDHGYGDEEFDDFVELVNALDAEYLTIMHESLKKGK